MFFKSTKASTTMERIDRVISYADLESTLGQNTEIKVIIRINIYKLVLIS